MGKKNKNKKSITPETKSNFGLKFIQSCFYILFFVTPLLLWPFTSEVFEFNKMIFVYIMTIIISSGWLIRSFANKKFEFVRTPLDIPLLLFLLSQIISTIVSIDPHTSLWGYYSRFHGGLMSTISYILLYYAFVAHFHNKEKEIGKVINSILISASLTAFYGVLEHFGIDKHVWVQDVQNRVFSTLGQPNWLSAYLIAIVPLSIHLGLKKNPAYFIYSTLYLLAIIYTKSQSGLAATFIVILLSLFVYARKTKYFSLIIPILVVGIIIKKDFVLRTLHSLNNINPFYSDSLTIAKKENETRIGGSDSMIIRRVVWDGAIQLGLKYPFFGTGVETFGYSYYWVRPVAHNYTSETDFLYNKAHNEYLNFLATTGFVGLFCYLLLIFSIIRIFKNGNHDLRLPLILGFTSILITNFFGFSVVNVALFFFLFPAIYLSIKSTEVKNIQLNFDPSLPYIITVSASIWSLIVVKNFWVADLAYVRGRSNLEQSMEAIKKNPKEPLYYAQLGYIQSLVATQIIAPQMAEVSTKSAEIAKKAQEYLNQYTNQAIENSKKAVEMNPYHINLVKSQSRTLITLASLDPKYYIDAINPMIKITTISPTDPVNYYNLGILYNNLGKTDEAKLAFQKVLEVFPDHAAAKDRLVEIEQQKNPAK